MNPADVLFAHVHVAAETTAAWLPMRHMTNYMALKEKTPGCNLLRDMLSSSGK